MTSFRNELTARGLSSIALSLGIALILVAACEGAVHLVRSPKALPFESTRTGTMAELALTQVDARVDVAFIGSSQCVGAVSPREFTAEWEKLTGQHVTAINMGVNGAVVRDIEAFHDVVVSRLKARTLVLLVGVPGAVDTGAGGVSHSYGMDWLRGDLGLVNDAVMRLWLFRYRRLWRDARWQLYVGRTRSLAGDLARRTGPDGDGWVPTGMGFGVFAPKVDHGLSADTKPLWDHWQMPSDAIAAVRGTLLRATENGSRVIIVVPPLAPRAARLYGDLAECHAELRRGLTEASRGLDVPLLDLHSPPGFSDAEFYDPFHVHGSAALPFSRLLADEMARSAAPPAPTAVP